MAISIPPIPTFSDPTLGTEDAARQEAWALVNAKYADTWAMATWASQIMNSGIVSLAQTLGEATVEADIEAITTEIGEILDFAPGVITGGNGVFSDTLLTSLRARLQADITAYSTGLGAVVEAAMFERETNRQNAIRAQAYKENTGIYSNNGWDMPPGAMFDTQMTLSNQSTQQLSESSGKILEESARLALDYNKHIISVSTQLISALAQVFDSQEARAFEASKASVMLLAESYKNTLGLVATKADIILKKGELALTANARHPQLEATTLLTLSQGFQQMVASAMNGVNSSTSFGFSGTQAQAFNEIV